jgi:hypothetical protein
MLFKNLSTRICEDCFIQVNEHLNISKPEYQAKFFKENLKKSINSRYRKSSSLSEFIIEKHNNSSNKVIDYETINKHDKSQSLIRTRSQISIKPKNVNADRSMVNRSKLSSASTNNVTKNSISILKSTKSTTKLTRQASKDVQGFSRLILVDDIGELNKKHGISLYKPSPEKNKIKFNILNSSIKI